MQSFWNSPLVKSYKSRCHRDSILDFCNDREHFRILHPSSFIEQRFNNRFFLDLCSPWQNFPLEKKISLRLMLALSLDYSIEENKHHNRIIKQNQTNKSHLSLPDTNTYFIFYAQDYHKLELFFIKCKNYISIHFNCVFLGYPYIR